MKQDVKTKLIELAIVANLTFLVTYLLYINNPDGWYWLQNLTAIIIVRILQFIFNYVFKK